jgi:hypothetical protein
VEVKIERLCSRLYMRAAIASGAGWRWESHSGSFLTHNNGNIDRKRKLQRTKTFDDEEEGESS